MTDIFSGGAFGVPLERGHRLQLDTTPIRPGQPPKEDVTDLLYGGYADEMPKLRDLPLHPLTEEDVEMATEKGERLTLKENLRHELQAKKDELQAKKDELEKAVAKIEEELQVTREKGQRLTNEMEEYNEVSDFLSVAIEQIEPHDEAMKRRAK